MKGNEEGVEKETAGWNRGILEQEAKCWPEQTRAEKRGYSGVKEKIQIREEGELKKVNMTIRCSRVLSLHEWQLCALTVWVQSNARSDWFRPPFMGDISLSDPRSSAPLAGAGFLLAFLSGPSSLTLETNDVMDQMCVASTSGGRMKSWFNSRLTCQKVDS